MTDHIKNEAEVEEDNMKVKKNKSKEGAPTIWVNGAVRRILTL